MWLEKLALPKFDNKIIEEINCCKTCYEEINKSDESLFNKNQKKKELINVVFEIFSGMFNLEYDTKIKYSSNNIDSEAIYVNSLKEDFDTIFYNLYLECFKRYLDKIYLFNEIRLDRKIYSIARLACLNRNEELIKVLANNAYIELINCGVDVSSNFETLKIGVEDISPLLSAEKKRVIRIKNNVFTLKVDDELSNYGIREVAACFSEHIFNSLDKSEKIHLVLLLYNYFSDEKIDSAQKYNRRINEHTSNIKCLNMVIEDLMIPGRTMIIKKKNIDIVNNVLSILPTIYSNEIFKSKVGALDSLKENIAIIKKNKR
jgi:hypothetical protein